MRCSTFGSRRAHPLAHARRQDDSRQGRRAGWDLAVRLVAEYLLLRSAPSRDPRPLPKITIPPAL